MVYEIKPDADLENADWIKLLERKKLIDAQRAALAKPTVAASEVEQARPPATPAKDNQDADS